MRSAGMAAFWSLVLAVSLAPATPAECAGADAGKKPEVDSSRHMRKVSVDGAAGRASADGGSGGLGEIEKILYESARNVKPGGESMKPCPVVDEAEKALSALL